MFDISIEMFDILTELFETYRDFNGNFWDLNQNVSDFKRNICNFGQNVRDFDRNVRDFNRNARDFDRNVWVFWPKCLSFNEMFQISTSWIFLPNLKFQPICFTIQRIFFPFRAKFLRFWFDRNFQDFDRNFRVFLSKC